MFDEWVVAATHAHGGAAVGAWARVEAAASARRLAAMVAMLDTQHAADGSAEREQWCIDNWGAVSAAIGAAQNITAGAASHQLLVAVALRDRLPTVAALFADGLVSYRVVAAITSRTMLIKDPDALHHVDTELASALRTWEPMSADKTTAAIDVFIDRHDPQAVRRTQNRARTRSLDIHFDDADALASVCGALLPADAKAFDTRLDTLADTVCANDPRTRDQRRADSVGAMAFSADRLGCRCGQPDCHAAPPPTTPAVIYVITHDDTLTDDTEAAHAQDAALDGNPPPHPPGKPLREQTLTEALHDPDPGEPAATRPGMLIGGPVLPGPITRRIALHAAIRKIVHPGDSPPEPRHTPSRRLADFVRCRDLTCRFPGCEEPATSCDIDHTIPYPAGPTQASNLKTLCRKHHLLKTFWGGDGGWHDRQSPDGTITWTAPDGQTYTTQPGSHLLFPSLCAPTAPIAATDVTATPHHATGSTTGLAMPRRATTRTKDRARRIDDERRANEEQANREAAQTVPPF